MEFPHVCEVKVNGRVLDANLRGMKNKPGTVSPANITRLCRLETGDPNKIEFIYANSTKRYYVSTHLVKKFSVESIVSEVEHGKFLSKEKMLQILEDRNKDDEIMATSSTLSLKCPLGFQRIKIPCRSSYCQHLQCFDAFTFFNLNEQTPTWTCPVCNRSMHSWEEIVVDGYFKDILSSTPYNLESITVQADGTWELPSATAQAPPSSPKKKPTMKPGVNVFMIDSDDADDDEQAAEIITPTPPPKSTKPTIEVIDLISDSEEEDDDYDDDDDDESNTPTPVRDVDENTTMQDIPAPQVDTGTGLSVKTESFDKPPSTETTTTTSAADTTLAAAAVPTEVHSIDGSANGSPTSGSSEISPFMSSRMVQADTMQTGPLSPPSRILSVWETSEDMFGQPLSNPRRKRQFDGKPGNSPLYY
ncbi:SUMO ligase siz1 [Modicella reniformis]|uniref:SUMO ligase siz1 n=1 Tax=Modicella reniformis TaxID=1440133 RepID=A0A9P6IZG5_9FUNG|nr:SUMO ligase siz1 [Modicella reniformis]